MSTLDSLTKTGNFVHGTVSSMISIAMWHPLFTIKTYAMAGEGLPKFRHLYRGYIPNQTCDISNQAVAFYANAFFAKIIMQGKPLSNTEKLMGGLFAGTVAAPLVGGLERFMILQQILNQQQTSQVKNREILRKIFMQEGARGLLKGLTPTIMRESTNSACFFGLSRVIFPIVETKVKNDKVATTVSYLVSGLIAGGITTPFDRIKTRMQRDLVGSTSFVKTVYKVAVEENRGAFRNLFTGAVPRMGVVGATMLTLGWLTEVIPPRLPSFLQEGGSLTCARGQVFAATGASVDASLPLDGKREKTEDN